MPGEAQVEELSVTKEGITLKSVALNTLATIATLIGVGMLLWIAWNHQQDAKASASELVAALKEQTQALREGNCLATYRGPEEQKAGFCKQVSR